MVGNSIVERQMVSTHDHSRRFRSTVPYMAFVWFLTVHITCFGTVVTFPNPAAAQGGCASFLKFIGKEVARSAARKLGERAAESLIGWYLAQKGYGWLSGTYTLTNQDILNLQELYERNGYTVCQLNQDLVLLLSIQR